MTEHERMLQSVLTNEVDPGRRDSTGTADNDIEMSENKMLGSTSEATHAAGDVVTEESRLESALRESKRLIQVICLWC